MVKRKKKGENGNLIVSKKIAKKLTIQQLLEHPTVKKMNDEIRNLRGMLEALPEAIGRAVTAANEKNRIPGIRVNNPEIFGFPLKGIDSGEVAHDIKRDLELAREELEKRKSNTSGG